MTFEADRELTEKMARLHLHAANHEKALRELQSACWALKTDLRLPECVRERLKWAALNFGDACNRAGGAKDDIGVALDRMVPTPLPNEAEVREAV